MNATDLRLDLSAELAAALDDGQQPADGELGEQFLRRRGVGAEIDDVVKARVALRGDGIAGRKGDRARPAGTFVDERLIDGRVADDEQAAAGLQRPPLDLGVGVLDTGPRLDQRQCRSRQILGRRDQHQLAVGRGDDPLVEQHIFLQSALEIVAEGGVGLVGRQPAVVGLDDEPLAGLVAVDAGSDLDDANDRLVAGTVGASPGT